MKEENQIMKWSLTDTMEHLKIMGAVISNKLFNTNFEGKGCKDVNEFRYDLLRAINALDKQVPKTVLYHGDVYTDGRRFCHTARCPNEDFVFERMDRLWGCKFCPNCGQALDW